MLNEARRLHALGFAIHWLRPKSKAPLESGWSKGPRKTLSQLSSQYKKDMNIGVRLGEASKLDGGYLAVIDCDVKSTMLSDLKEMKMKLVELGIEWKKAPTVASGRGNGSMHIYMKSSVPVTPRRLPQSPNKVKVYMPSVAASAGDKKFLTIDELQQGMRMRAAWEISLMGEGQQVVLPPSIHPDSGKPYTWSEPLISVDDIPLLPNVLAVTALKRTINSRSGTQESLLGQLTPVRVELWETDLSQHIVALIEKGEGCDDRSAGLMSAALAMCGVGMTDQQILSVLTDKDNYLGKAAYDHTKSDSRSVAADWVRKFTLEKARAATSAAAAFSDEVEVSDLPPEVLEKQNAEILDVPHWTSKLDRIKEGNRVKITLNNIIMILQNATGEKLVCRNEFANEDIYGCDAPWGNKKGTEVKNDDVVLIKSWLGTNFNIEPNQNLIREALTKLALQNKYHPVKNYLNALEWDGKSRIDTWLKYYMDAKAPELYLSAVSRKVLIAMVARIYEPGYKFDHVLILQGGQGVGKSTSLNFLVGDEWFSDAYINMADKDGVLSMRTAWLIELGELSGMGRVEINQVKDFITRRNDRIRVPYGHKTESFPRHCIFIGTTNNDEFLKDETGNRRFWPVTVGSCDFKALKRDRDQLFAEAKFAYELGEVTHLASREENAIARAEQAKRMEGDILTEQLQNWFEKEHDNFNKDEFLLSELFGDHGPFPRKNENRQEQLRMARALRMLGYEKSDKRYMGNKVQKVWRKQSEL